MRGSESAAGRFLGPGYCDISIRVVQNMNVSMGGATGRPVDEIQVTGMFQQSELSQLQGHCADCGLSTFAWCDGKPLGDAHGNVVGFAKCAAPRQGACRHTPLCNFCGANAAWCHYCAGKACATPKPHWLSGTDTERNVLAEMFATPKPRWLNPEFPRGAAAPKPR